MEQIIAATEDEIKQLQEEYEALGTPQCTHLVCHSCLLNIENEAKEKLRIQMIINEKNRFIEKLKQYGIN